LLCVARNHKISSVKTDQVEGDYQLNNLLCKTIKSDYLNLLL
jgi:hypothetical protein